VHSPSEDLPIVLESVDPPLYRVYSGNRVFIQGKVLSCSIVSCGISG